MDTSFTTDNTSTFRRWDHFCSLDRSMGHSIVDNSLSEISDGRADSIKEDSPDPNSPFTSGIRTLPVRGPKKRPSLASITNCAPIKESSPATTSQQGVEVEKESTPFEKGNFRVEFIQIPIISEKSPKTPNLSDKEASSSMTYSSYLANREGSRVSNITCSTLERSSVSSTTKQMPHWFILAASPTARSDDPNGRAPLALPEELTASTTNSVISSSLTPEREQHSDSAVIELEYSLHQNERNFRIFGPKLPQLIRQESEAIQSKSSRYQDYSLEKIWEILPISVYVNDAFAKRFGWAERYWSLSDSTINIVAVNREQGSAISKHFTAHHFSVLHEGKKNIFEGNNDNNKMVA